MLADHNAAMVKRVATMLKIHCSGLGGCDQWQGSNRGEPPTQAGRRDSRYFVRTRVNYRIAQRPREAGSVSKHYLPLGARRCGSCEKPRWEASGTRHVIKQRMTADLVPAIRAVLAGKLFLSCLDASPTILMAGGVNWSWRCGL